MPAPRMMKAIAMVVIYSIRPCPNGCSLSAPFAASFVPAIVNTEERTSVKLFTASRIMAMEFDANPIIILKMTSTTLPIMPLILASVIPRLRSALFSCKIILLHLLHTICTILNNLYVYVYLYYSLWIIICHYIYLYISMKSIDFTEFISHSHFSIRNFYIFKNSFYY